MKPRIGLSALIALLCLGWTTIPAVSHAGFGDALKKKISDKATQKTDAAVDKAAEKPAAKTGTEPPAVEGETGKGTSSGSGQVSSVSSKFDFVPGDKVIFADDFSQDELGPRCPSSGPWSSTPTGSTRPATPSR
jgi:OOP family OmpA-OmpF porin